MGATPRLTPGVIPGVIPGARATRYSSSPSIRSLKFMRFDMAGVPPALSRDPLKECA